MARERINLVSEEILKDQSIAQQINSNLLTNEVYNSLSVAEQNNVKKVLFEMYSEPVVAPEALSGLEFAIFGLAKLFFRVESDTPLTEAESVYYDRFRQFIDQHEITLDPTDWHVPYAEAKMLKAKENRADYKQRKTEITGNF